MHHISDLHIHQFRGLRDLELQSMGQINLLVGGNNSGKTSILEAVAAFCRPLDPLEWIAVARRREITAARISVLEALKWLFPQITVATNGDLFQSEIYISGRGTFPVRTARARFHEIISSPSVGDGDEVVLTETPRRGADIALSAIAEGSQISWFEPDLSLTFQLWEDERFVQRRRALPPMLDVRTIAPHMHRVAEVQIGRLSETAFQDLRSSAVALLQTFDPDVEDLNVWSSSGVRPTLYIRHKQFGLAPLSSFGDGMRRVLLMATTIPLCRNGVLLIDELETAIHTQALQRTFRWLINACIEHNIQMFATTHSLEAVDTLLDVSGPEIEFVSYRLQQHSDKTTATRLDQELLSLLREELGQEVRW